MASRSPCLDVTRHARLFRDARSDHIAIQRGHRLEWNPETERFTNGEEANLLLAGTPRDKWKI